MWFFIEMKYQVKWSIRKTKVVHYVLEKYAFVKRKENICHRMLLDMNKTKMKFWNN